MVMTLIGPAHARRRKATRSRSGEIKNRGEAVGCLETVILFGARMSVKGLDNLNLSFQMMHLAVAVTQP